MRRAGRQFGGRMVTITEPGSVGSRFCSVQYTLELSTLSAVAI
jgi:hypothetical protein